MAFTGNFMCTSFKQQILEGVHDFRASPSGDVFNIALYTNSASFTAATTAYTTSDEITNASGSAYVAGGQALDNVSPSTSGTTALTDFADETWSSASFTARGALIYKEGANGAVCVLDFGNNVTSNGTFTVTMPANTSTSALIRLV